MKKILIIEDETSISEFIKIELKYEGYETHVQEDGRAGLMDGIQNDYDLIILDIMLPSMNGFEVCRRLKREKNTPIIILSAKDTVMDKVNGLQIGADDYLAKPFAIEELLARIEVIFRRQEPYRNNLLRYKEITIERVARIVKRSGEPISLTNKEYELLVFLIEHKGEVVSRDEMLENIWGYDYASETNVIDVYIKHLRQKLNSVDKEEYIQTIRSVGYRLRD